MNTQALATTYYSISEKLHQAGFILLAMDYRCGEYLEGEKRNATLHVMAKTLERSMA